jgi:hypothetical protein
MQWTTAYKQNWEPAWQRMKAWWENGELDRPLVVSPIVKRGGPWSPPAADPAEMERRDLDASFYVEWRRHHLRECHFTAESAPSTWSRFGNGLGHVAAVADAALRYADTTVWIDETPDLFDRRDPPPFDPDHAVCRFEREVLRAFEAEFGSDVVLGSGHLLDPLTTLSMMRGAGNLCIDLIERPNDVRRWTRALGDIFLGIQREVRKIREELGRMDDFHPMGVWADGTVEALQCDFCTMLSPDMFREFVLPEAEREAANTDYPFWHLDGTAEFVHLPEICAIPNIRAIQWVDEQRGRSPVEHVEQWKKVRAAGKGLLIATELGEAVELTRRLGPDGLAFRLVDVASLDNLDAALAALKKAGGR